MNADKKSPTLRALRDLGLLAAASLAAASIWATGLPEEGYLLDAEMWQSELAADTASRWPADGWYRLVPQAKSVEVVAVKPGDGAAVPERAIYFRLPGTKLKLGERPAYRFPQLLESPRLGQDHELTFGRARVSLRVEAAPKGMQYVIAYGGQTYTYTLAPFDATETAIRAIADLDGDALPDFLIDVGEDATYLLLSTRARPGANVPTAELWAKGC